MTESTTDQTAVEPALGARAWGPDLECKAIGCRSPGQTKMRINELFCIVQSCGLVDDERIRINCIIRRILDGRRGVSLPNNVTSLFQARHTVARHLGVHVRDLDVIWGLPPVRAHLDLVEGDEIQEDEQDLDYVPDKDSDRHADSNSADDHPSNEAIRGIHEHILGLRRQVLWIGGAAVMLHVIAALVTMLAHLPATVVSLPSVRATFVQAVELWHRATGRFGVVPCG